MPELENLLRRRWRKQNWQWKTLTTGDTLFSALQAAVRNRRLGKASEQVETWQPFVQEDRSRQSDWNIIRALVWCAEQAVSYPDYYRKDAAEKREFALPKVPEFVKEQETWARICIRTLLGIFAQHRVEVPVAGWNKKQDENGGFLATLLLEILADGAEQIAHHPQDVFCTKPNKEFHKSLRDAWSAAHDLLQKQGVDLKSCDGRWRLLKGWSPASQPHAEANDRSASGAAARGWWHALQSKVLDEGLIVLAEIDSGGILGKVDGIAAKVQAIAKNGHFDTIAVTSENYHEARETLEATGTAIRVVKIGD